MSNFSPNEHSGVSVDLEKQRLVQAREEQIARWELTPVEVETLKLLPLGHQDAVIAAIIGSRRYEVSEQISSIFRKVGVKSRTEAATIAYELFEDELAPFINIDISKFASLNVAEREVLKGLAAGLSIPEIAGRQPGLSDSFYYHAQQVYKKLGIKRVQTGIFLAETSKVIQTDGDDTFSDEVSVPEPENQNSDQPERTSVRFERPLPDTVRLNTLGIKGARQIIKKIPPEELSSFRELSFTITSEVLLKVLHANKLISDEENEARQIGVVGATAAWVIHNTKSGKELLVGGSKDKKENRKVFTDTVIKELNDQVERANWPEDRLDKA